MDFTKRFFSTFFIAAAILGYAAGYGKIYIFHSLIPIYFLFLLAGIYKINKKAITIISIIVILSIPFISYSLISKNQNTINYLFYYSCGIICILLMSNLKTEKEIKTAYKTIFLFLFLNLFFGALESLNLIRLPFSPYSVHFDKFGRSLQEINPNLLNSLNKNTPTGFNFNPNNFGFVALISFPYFILHRSMAIKTIAIITISIILTSIESKGFIISFMLLIISYPILFFNKKQNLIIIIFYLMISIIITIIIFLFGSEIHFSNRSLTVFEQISRGIKLMLSPETAPIDSTSERAYIYILGIKQLIDSYGIGLGIGGISNELLQHENIVKSFHFFFLEFIIDFGIYFGLPIIFLYYKHIIYLAKKSKAKQEFESYILKATSLSLFIAVPASISPSSIIYILTFWIILGFSFSLRKI